MVKKENGLIYLEENDNPYYYLIKTIDKDIEEAIINENTKVIYYYAFSYCNKLKNIKIPNSVTHIEDYAFEGCSNLTSIEIPNSVSNIGEFVFWKCSNLTIYCEANRKPKNWSRYWNPDNRPIVRNYKQIESKEG